MKTTIKLNSNTTIELEGSALEIAQIIKHLINTETNFDFKIRNVAPGNVSPINVAEFKSDPYAPPYKWTAAMVEPFNSMAPGFVRDMVGHYYGKTGEVK